LDVLDRIVGRKLKRLQETKSSIPFDVIRQRARKAGKCRDFAGALKRPPDSPIRLIAEIKRASPSKGIIRTDFSPENIARIYGEKGVSAISVLTEEDFFEGSIDYLPIVRNAVGCPILRKDFIVDAYQVF
jgi:indole-3-glycerol phosphate synthase